MKIEVEHMTGEFRDPPIHGYVIDYDPAHRGYWILNSYKELVINFDTYDEAVDWCKNQK